MSARRSASLVLPTLLLVAAPASAEVPWPVSPMAPSSPAPDPAPAPSEPSLPELLRAAIAAARLDPNHVASLERRMRAAALLPQLRMRVGRGTGQILTTSEYDGTARLSVGDRDAWQVDLSASWSLDRLAYHADELRLVREVQRAAAHRERLLRQVAELYTERRRLRQAIQRSRPPIAGGPGVSPGSAVASSPAPAPGSGSSPPPAATDDLALRYAAVTATLDALTGGALLRER